MRIEGKILADPRLHRAFGVERWRLFMCNLMACGAVESWTTLSRSAKSAKFNQALLHHPLHQTGRLNHHHHHIFLCANLHSLILLQH